MVDRCSAAIESAFVVFLEIPSYLDGLTHSGGDVPPSLQAR